MVYIGTYMFYVGIIYYYILISVYKFYIGFYRLYIVQVVCTALVHKRTCMGIAMGDTSGPEDLKDLLPQVARML